VTKFQKGTPRARVSDTATSLDKPSPFRLHNPQRISFTQKDASRATPAGGARAVPAGGGSSPSLPGGSGDIRPAGTMTGLREARWTGTGGGRQHLLTPHPRKRVSGAELRRSFAAASAAVERRQASALAFSARRICRCGHCTKCVCRRSASFYLLAFVAWVERSETRERHSSRAFVPGFRFAQSGLRRFVCYGASFARLGRASVARTRRHCRA
jgi:hypothetical protein